MGMSGPCRRLRCPGLKSLKELLARHPLPASAPRGQSTGLRGLGLAHRTLRPLREGGAAAPLPRTMGVTGRRWIVRPRERRLVLGEAGPGVGLPQALEGEEMRGP